jgi:RNA polymerase sigma-70 factor (ECF subfamily)
MGRRANAPRRQRFVVANAPDTPSVEQVYRQHAHYVARVAARILGREGDVDDVVQEVFLRAWRGLEQLRDPHAIKGWLATITVRIAGRHLRLRKLQSLFGLASTKDVSDPHRRRLRSGRSRSAFTRDGLLEKLPVHERTARVLRHVEGEALQEVAAMCECSLATAKRRIASAHRKLERALSDG